MSATPDPVARRFAWAALAIALLALWRPCEGTSPSAAEAFSLADEANNRADEANSRAETASAEADRAQRMASEALETANRVERRY